MAGRALRGALLSASLVVASCAERSSSVPRIGDDLATSSTRSLPRDGRVILVTVDGVRWQDVFEGSSPGFSGQPSLPPEALMPRAHALVRARGVALGASREGCGIVHTAGGSNVSLPGYLEIFTGRRSRCLDNACAQVEDTVLDEAARTKVGGVASVGSWETLVRAVSGGDAGVFVSAGRTWPDGAPSSERLDALAVAGLNAAPFPGVGAYRPDAATAPIALEYLRAAQPALLHIGLGDTDSHGHRGDYAAYLKALQRADDMLGELADLLATMGERGDKTTVIVTPDHGRNSDFKNHGLFHPESGRTFILAFGGRVPVQGLACPESDLTLADIAPTIRVLMGLPADTRSEGRPIELITGPR